ncbi:outer membrane protein assembly factor BamA [Minwuia thermotolerans]|uniref:Outer membrane protein assembly factor BamA n=2 Tax=Minwuia thermotolerans TaxID=2056226 RepID=A0A2M9G1Z4_9PROT|nr:outer membrane protein assembly factor BamA [Minwuia thermotolerans]
MIEDIAVEGNQRIEAETVRSYMRLQTGNAYERKELDAALKRLYATGLFADVTFRRQGDVLVVSVVENPVINQIAFEGNKALDDDSLSAEVQLRPRIVYTRARVQSDVQRLLQLYRVSGRFAAVIEPKIIQLPQNRINLVFEIQEGTPTEVRAIRFLGNEEFSDSELRSEISTQESAWYSFFSTTDIYDPDLIALDRERLRQFYLNNGYVDFRVLSAVAELTPDRKDFFITFTVEEGEQYTISSVEIDASVKDVDPETLRASIADEPGDIYSAERIEQAIQDIKFELGRRGFAFVEVRPRTQRNREERTIDLTYQVREGPRVYVERIDIEGNTRTLDSVIRRELQLIEGDAFDTAKLERSRRRLRAIDYFSNIQIQPEQGTRPDRAVIKVEVEEQPTGELSLGAGFSTSEAVIGDVSIRERNLLGRGQDLRLGLSLSLRRREIDLSFTEPYFLDKPIAAGFDIFNTNLDFQDESSFDQSTTGFRLRSGVSLSQHLRLNLNYQFRRDNIKNVGATASLFIQQQQGVAFTSSVGYTLRYDQTDDPITPTSGFVTTLEQEFAGLGGDVRDIRTQVRHAQFFPLWGDFVLQQSVRGGAVVGLFEDIRINRRFFVGGDTFRGFAPSGVGPRDVATRDALGGEFFAVGTTELQFPLGLPEELGMSGRVFSDYGTAFGVVANGVEDDPSPRLSFGVGVTWKSPFGPMLFDVSRAVLKNDFDETEAFRFSFGTRF